MLDALNWAKLDPCSVPAPRASLGGDRAARLPQGHSSSCSCSVRAQPVPWDGTLCRERCTDSALSTWKGQWRMALLGGPKAQALTSTASPTPLRYPQLWEAARAQCDPSLGSPEIPIWISGQCWARFPSSSTAALPQSDQH